VFFFFFFPSSIIRKQNSSDCLPLRLRSTVGLVPLFAVGNLLSSQSDLLSGFGKRTKWFLQFNPSLSKTTSLLATSANLELLLLAIPNRDRLIRVLKYLLDENEFLSKYGIRSMSRYHHDHPYELRLHEQTFEVKYVSGESNIPLFGGNSNWRGPIWFPMNFLIIESLEKFYNFYGDTLQMEYPTGSGKLLNLSDIATSLCCRLASLFLPENDKGRPCHGGADLYADNEHWKHLVLFHEYFDGDSGKGLGANHQTGWTALVAMCLQNIGKKRAKTCADSFKCGYSSS